MTAYISLIVQVVISVWNFFASAHGWPVVPTSAQAGVGVAGIGLHHFLQYRKSKGAAQ